MLTKAHGAWPRKGAHQAVSTPSCNAAQPFAASCNKAQGSATHVRARVASRGRAPKDGIAAARATVALSAHNSEPWGKMTVTFVLCRTASAARNAPNSINLKHRSEIDGETLATHIRTLARNAGRAGKEEA